MRLLISPINHNKLKHDLLWVVVFTFVTVLLWISYSIYLAYNQSTIDPDVSSLLEPLDPTLDQETLELMNNRFQPPEDFTILVKRQVGDSIIIVPIDQQIDSESLADSNKFSDSLSGLDSSASADFFSDEFLEFAIDDDLE